MAQPCFLRQRVMSPAGCGMNRQGTVYGVHIPAGRAFQARVSFVIIGCTDMVIIGIGLGIVEGNRDST